MEMPKPIPIPEPIPEQISQLTLEPIPILKPIPEPPPEPTPEIDSRADSRKLWSYPESIPMKTCHHYSRGGKLFNLRHVVRHTVAEQGEKQQRWCIVRLTDLQNQKS